MELFFMMTAMLALLGPIAVGRVRCIRISPRLLALVKSIHPTVPHGEGASRRAGNKPSDGGMFSGNLAWAALLVYAKQVLRRQQRDFLGYARVHSSVTAWLGWLASAGAIGSNQPA
jgi:hypothetical protein